MTYPPRTVLGMSIFDDFDRTGQWTVPPLGNNLCGKLVRDKDGTSLHVMHVPQTRDFTRQAMHGMADRSLHTLPSIRGIMETGEHVILNKCVESHRRFTAFDTSPNTPDPNPEEKTPGVITARYDASSMYVSKTPLSDSPAFTNMLATYTSLLSWLGQNQARLESGPNSSLSLTVEMPEDHETHISDELSLHISCPKIFEHSLLQSESYHFRRSASIKFVAPLPRPPSWFYNHIQTFGNFLMMATKIPVCTKTLLSIQDGHDVGIFPHHLNYVKPEGDESTLKMYFNYKMIQGEFDKMITSWFKLAKKYKIAMDLYFTARLNGHSLLPKLDFLAGVQALESFFRAKYPDKDTTTKNMLNLLIAESYKLFNTPKDKGNFVLSVANTRDSLSHGFLDKPNNLTSKPIDFNSAAIKVDLLIYGCILKELDASDTLKTKIFDQKKSYADSIRFVTSF